MKSLFTSWQFRSPLQAVPKTIVFQGGMVVDAAGTWVKIVVTRGPVTTDRPQGLEHTLTFYDAKGEPLDRKTPARKPSHG